MTALVWKWRRLRAMSAREVAYRGSSWLLQRIERARVLRGWAPRPRTHVEPAASLFDPQTDWLAAWHERYRLDQVGLERLLAGRIDLFGRPLMTLGMPPDWHRDPLSGTVAPPAYGKALDYRDEARVGNIKLLWELSRHQHLVPLAAAYALTGQTRHRDAVVVQIEDWIARNPFGLGIHWCSSLELALRLIAWSFVHGLLALRDGPQGLFGAVGDREALGLAVYRHAHLIRGHLSRHSSANNHLIGELTGLWIATRVFDLGRDGERWGDEARAMLEREAALQVHADGVDKEQAVYYHLWVLEYLLLAWLVGERYGKPFSARFRQTILSMAAFLDDLCPEGGDPPQVGDADDGFAARFEASWPHRPFRDVLCAVRHAMGGGECGELTQKAFWYGAMVGVTRERPLSEPAAGYPRIYPKIYKSGGYAILRAGRTHLVFDAGPLGYPSIAAHAHADALNVCLALGKEWWLVDPGTYCYHGEPQWRAYFRGTRAHNTITLDGADQSIMAGPFLWLRHARARLEGAGVSPSGWQWAAGSHDGYKGVGVIHSRAVRLSPDGADVTVTDRLQGTGIHNAEICFHFAPGVSLALNDAGGLLVASRVDSPWRMELALDARCAWTIACGAEHPILGWCSGTLFDKQPSATLHGHWSGELPGAHHAYRRPCCRGQTPPSAPKPACRVLRARRGAKKTRAAN